jgi:hypothetical protein
MHDPKREAASTRRIYWLVVRGTILAQGFSHRTTSILLRARGIIRPATGIALGILAGGAVARR